MEKKTLESLVPPLDLCKKIPEGAFADSALVWFGHRHTDKTMAVVPRNELGVGCQFFLQKGVRVAYPAPTLEEIMAALARLELCPGIDLVVNIKGEVCGSVNAACRDVGFCGGSLAAAALRVWFDVKRRG